MFSWAEVENRSRPVRRDDQLREYAQMEMGSYAFPILFSQILGGVAGQRRPKEKRKTRKDDDMSEVQIEASHPTSTR